MDLDGIIEECEAIEAIYCGTNEMTTWVRDGDDIVRLAVTVVPSLRSGPVIATFSIIALRYPDEAPSISLQSIDRSSVCDWPDLQDHLENTASSNLGSPMLLTLMTEVASWQYSSTPQDRRVAVEEASDCAKYGGELSAACGGAAASSVNSDTDRQQVCLLSLQHMRSKGPYLRTMARWCQQLGLVARVLFVRKAIVVMLLGDAECIKKYIQRNRTEIVDVDSKGRGCKERLLSVLHTARVVHPRDSDEAECSGSRSATPGVHGSHLTNKNIKYRHIDEKQTKYVSDTTVADTVAFDHKKVTETFRVIEVDSKQDLEERLKEDGMELLSKIVMNFV